MVLSHIHLLRFFHISAIYIREAEYSTYPGDPNTHCDLLRACTWGSAATVGLVIYITALMCFNDGVSTISLKG